MVYSLANLLYFRSDGLYRLPKMMQPVSGCVEAIITGMGSMLRPPNGGTE